MATIYELADINLDLKSVLQKFNEFTKQNDEKQNDQKQNYEKQSDASLLLNLMKLNAVIIDFLNTKLKLAPALKHDLIEGVSKDGINNYDLEIERNPEDIIHHIRTVRHYQNKLICFNKNILNRCPKYGKMIWKGTIGKNECRSRIDLTKNCKKFLKKDFGAFTKEFSPIAFNLHNPASYESIKKNLLQLFTPIYPELKVLFFGSRMNGLANFESDLDIFLDIGTMFTDYNVPKKKVVEILKVVSNELKQQNNNVWHDLREVTEASVPILKVYNIEKGIKCDISFSNGVALMNTLLVRHYFELQPICKSHKMCLFIKNWLATTSIEVSTSGFIMLTIFFLQIKKKLPSIKQLQDGVKPFEIGPWQCDFDYKKKLIDFGMDIIDDGNKNCTEYLIQFFQYYGDFNFDKFVLSPYCGKTINKGEFNKSEINEFPRYAAHYNKNRRTNTLDLSKSMCVQDPYELNRNMTKSVTRKGVRTIKFYCQKSASLLILKRKVNCEEV